VLYTMTKPRMAYQLLGLEIGSDLLGPFGKGRGGPGGWWIVDVRMDDGATALSLTAKGKHPEAAELLRRRGARADHRPHRVTDSR
jgi:hypothetical protein